RRCREKSGLRSEAAQSGSRASRLSRDDGAGAPRRTVGCFATRPGSGEDCSRAGYLRVTSALSLLADATSTHVRILRLRRSHARVTEVTQAWPVNCVRRMMDCPLEARRGSGDAKAAERELRLPCRLALCLVREKA